MSQPMMSGNPRVGSPVMDSNQVQQGYNQANRNANGVSTHVSLWNSVRSEFVKLASVKSTWILQIINAVFMVIGAELSSQSIKLAAEISADGDDSMASQIIEVTASSYWSSITAFMHAIIIVVGIFGVMSVTAEFTTSSIESTLVANPHRNMVLGAKAIAVMIYTWCSAQIATLLSWGAVHLAFSGVKISSLAAGEGTLPWVVIFGTPLVEAFFALLAVGVGVLCRSTVGGVFVIIIMTMFLPLIVVIILSMSSAAAWSLTISRLLPMTLIDTFLQGGVKVSSIGPVSGYLPSWWEAGIIFVVWAVVFYIVGAIVMARRDIK